MNRLKWIVIGALLCLFSEAGAAGKDWVKYVNTLQGTNSSFELSRGNTYPAVAMPWGMNFWTDRRKPEWLYLSLCRGYYPGIPADSSM
mgnify:CR=1 FL=1